jgi:hypothetical protein
MTLPSKFTASLFAAALTAIALTSPAPVRADANRPGVTPSTQQPTDISAQSKKAKKKTPKKAKKPGKGHLGHH